jgi:2-aminoadipate transaminase
MIAGSKRYRAARTPRPDQATCRPKSLSRIRRRALAPGNSYRRRLVNAAFASFACPTRAGGPRETAGIDSSERPTMHRRNRGARCSMTFAYRYSELCEGTRPSPIRELFRMIQRPGMISFAGGWPDPAVFPVGEFAACADALSKHGKVALQYGASEGYSPLVAEIQRRMVVRLGRPISPEQIVISSGSQQIMDMVARVLVDPGDAIVVEAPTYPGALHTFRAAGARFATVPCDAEGMRVELLPDVAKRCQHDTGRLPKFIYTVANFSNPSGACLSEVRRRLLTEAARELGIPVLEDDPYGELRYRGDRQATLFSHTDNGVLFASSFSKILAPGVRVAWAVGDAELIRKMVIAKQGMDLCTSMVAQVLVTEYCQRGFLDAHIERIKTHYAAKAAAMAAALRDHLPAHVSFVEPDGGFFFWLSLGGDSQQILERALHQGVAFLPGPAFYPEPRETAGEVVDGRPFARLCFTFATPAEIVEGARRLARAIAPK